MSIKSVQCKGSGQTIAGVGFTKRGVCPVCHRTQDLTSDGKLRKHSRLVRTAQLKRMR